MLRHVAAASLFCSAALAAEIDPGGTPGLMLLNGGITGSANEVAQPPPLDIHVRNIRLTLETSKLDDVVKILGGEVHTAGESENAFAWLCYASPDANSGGTTLTWFYGVDAAAQLVSGVAAEFAPDEVSSGCTRLEEPLDLTTGLPGLGAPVADLNRAFGKATADSGEPGTNAYIFGGAPSADGLIARAQARYILGDTHVLAMSVMSVEEPQ